MFESFECFEFDVLDEIRCVPNGGESSELNLPQTADCWYTSGDVKKTDAVMGAKFAGLMIRNPLGVRELSKFENCPAVSMGNDRSSLDLHSQ